MYEGFHITISSPPECGSNSGAADARGAHSSEIVQLRVCARASAPLMPCNRKYVSRPSHSEPSGISLPK